MSQALAGGRAAGVMPPLPDGISRLLARPDLRIAPHERSIAFVADLAGPFTVAADGHVSLGPACLARGEAGACLLRHALELAWLMPRLPAAPALAGLAAARCAALFSAIHGGPAAGWHDAMAAPDMPDPAMLSAVWSQLAPLQPAAPAGLDAQPGSQTIARLRDAWPLLGPAEALLQAGGDQRLRVDPATGLNFYGCSHRPRPWAVTFASSTASSSSERGFAAAEGTRQQVTVAALGGLPGASPAVATTLAELAVQVRSEIADALRLPAGAAVVLAASGTDCELLTLAVCASAATRVTSILVAPEETGSGVPLACTGRHFAGDTARGVAVAKGEAIAGYPADVVLSCVPARRTDGTLRPAAEVDAQCAAAADAAVADGHQVILHLLDLSKTGFLAPSIAGVQAMVDRHGTAIQVVVDACQFRCGAERLAGYVARGWIVLTTGSKFLTGPPFAGAVLLPPGFAWPRHLPSGLADYVSAAECGAGADVLPACPNYGLLLRWRAALAELHALHAVPPDRRRDILQRFCGRVRQAIVQNPDLALLDTPGPCRDGQSDTAGAWDDQPTILAFAVRPRDPLDPADARRVYHWLNADLRPGLPAVLTAEQERLACLRCHIGQPVPLPWLGAPAGRLIGALRLSAGARLVSGEPSHHDLDEDARLLREIADALSVLAKISLILAHWDSLLAADPQPSF